MHVSQQTTKVEMSQLTSRTNQKQRRVIQVAEDIRYLHGIIDKLSITRRLWISIAVVH